MTDKYKTALTRFQTFFYGMHEDTDPVEQNLYQALWPIHDTVCEALIKCINDAAALPSATDTIE